VVDHIDKLADKNYQTLAGLTTPEIENNGQKQHQQFLISR